MPENKPYGARDAYRSPNGSIYMGDVTVFDGETVQDAYTYVRPGFGEYGHLTYKNGEEVEFPTSQQQKWPKIYIKGWLNSASYNNRTIVSHRVDGIEVNTHDCKTDVLIGESKFPKVDVSEGSVRNSVEIRDSRHKVVKLGENDKLELLNWKVNDGGVHQSPGLYIQDRPLDFPARNGVTKYSTNNPLYNLNVLGF